MLQTRKIKITGPRSKLINNCFITLFILNSMLVLNLADTVTEVSTDLIMITRKIIGLVLIGMLMSRLLCCMHVEIYHGVCFIRNGKIFTSSCTRTRLAVTFDAVER